MSTTRAATLLTSFAAVYFAAHGASAMSDLDLADAGLAAVLAALFLRASVGLAQAVTLESGGPT